MLTKLSGLLIIVAMMIIASSAVSEKKLPPGCLPNFAPCNTFQSEACLSRYCYADGTCREFGSTSDDAETNDFCAVENACPDNQICTYNTVQCVRAPCGPVKGCVDKCKTSCPT